MRRREFLALVGGTAAWSVAVSAQQPSKVWRLGVLEAIPRAHNAANLAALRTGLELLGYIEGKNLLIEYRSADGRIERFPELAAELVRLKVDVIVTRGTPSVLAAKTATSTIPIIMAASGGPLDTGVVAELARPGGNVTGLSALTGELVGKRLELLSEAIAGLKRIVYLNNMSNPVAPPQWEELKAAAQSLGIEAQLLDVRRPEDLAPAVEAASIRRAALIVGNDTVTHASSEQVVELAMKHRLPAIYATREFVDAGGLIAYAVSYPDLYRRAATYVDQVLKGANPGELSIQQPTKFELVINLKTAKALGITVPNSLLARADEVIE